LSEEHSLLPAQHMGAHPGRSIDTALEFLMKLIHATWHNKDRAVMLLSLDMTGALNRVKQAQLLYNMRKRIIPVWIVSWASLVWFYSYALSGVAHADPLSSYRKKKTLWGIKHLPLRSSCLSVNFIVTVSYGSKIVVQLCY
jgi:hypothetical protein